MNVHFLNTGPQFPYTYYLGVLTALRVYPSKVMLWLTQRPDSRYFGALRERDGLEIVDIGDRLPGYDTLVGCTPHLRRVTEFDYFIWRIVRDHGGALMGLDSVTLKPWHDLLEPDKEMLVPIDDENWHGRADKRFSMHGVVIRADSEIAAMICEDAEMALSGNNPDHPIPALESGKMRWGGAGIIPFINNVKANLDRVSIAEYGLLGGYEHDERTFYMYRPDGELLHPDARTIPLYASSQAAPHGGVIDAQYIARSETLIARLIQDTLPKTDWDLRPRAQVAVAKPRKGYRFHIPGYVHLPISDRYAGCAFTQKIVKLSKMLLSLGHEVILYGAEGSSAPCTSFVQTHTLSDIRREWGTGDNRFEIGYDWRRDGFRHDFSSPRTETTERYYKTVAEEINALKQPDDFLLIMQGVYQKPIADKVGLWLTCEPGIGYRGSFARFRAFESAYLQNFTYGSEHPGQCINGHYYDRVIPNYFDPDDFPFCADKDDYFLYIGRMIERKGVWTAVKATEAVGARLLLAGQQSSEIDVKALPPHCEFVGYVEPDERARLMGRARAVFVPTLYLEAFGGVNVEAQLCGTPVITTNFGVFPETIEHKHGNTGFLCNTLQDFINAARNVSALDPYAIRKHAERYLMDNVRWEFNRWFKDLYQLRLSAINPNVRGWHHYE